MPIRFRIGLVLGATAAVAMMLTGIALGDSDVRIVSTVTLAKPNPFHGHVSARKHACETNRLVRVIKVKSGPNRVVGATRTNTNGKWSIPAATSPKGDYFARLKRRRKEIAGGTTTYVCTADHSAIRHFGT